MRALLLAVWIATVGFLLLAAPTAARSQTGEKHRLREQETLHCGCSREARVIHFERAPPRIVEGCKRKAINENNFTT
ncbi:MAG TPA: hypothetical protein DCK99_04705 [Blastocatellia bacterium]|jgi:hypothetical protein|nr:hypothetical protein [Blastocatellia bacterium]